MSPKTSGDSEDDVRRNVIQAMWDYQQKKKPGAESDEEMDEKNSAVGDEDLDTKMKAITLHEDSIVPVN